MRESAQFGIFYMASVGWGYVLALQRVRWYIGGCAGDCHVAALLAMTWEGSLYALGSSCTRADTIRPYGIASDASRRGGYQPPVGTGSGFVRTR